MPNGGSWDRFWFTIMGFRAEYGRWPTRVLLPSGVRDVVEAHLKPDDRARLKEKLSILPATALAAEDESGARYDYTGPAGGGHHLERQEWFGIDWD
jgi:hypothetical protein